MRFLVDSCAGRTLADWLCALGHDAVRVTDAAADPGDEARILVTMDKDFGALIHRVGMDHAGVIRLPHVPTAARIELMRAVLGRHGAADLQGAMVTVRGSRIRILRRPDAP